MAKRKNLISFLLDRTGSMSPIWDSTIDGFNEFLKGQKAQDYKTVWNVTIFDSESIDLIRDEVKGKDMKKLKTTDFEPRAMTPLHDAIGRTIVATDQIADNFDGVIFVILTDGQENASREYDLEKVHKMVRKRESKNWQFIFLGANMDAYVEAQKYGIYDGQSVTYSADDKSVSETFSVMAASTSEYASTGSQVSSHDDTRTDKEDDE